jgi:hypothetical protein
MQKLLLLTLLASLIGCAGKSEKKEVKDTVIQTGAIDEPKEKEAILNVIEKETECFFKRDYDCWKNQFAQTDYTFQAWNNSDGTVDAQAGWMAIDKRSKDYLSNPVNKPQERQYGQEYNIKETPASHPSVIRKNMVVKFFSPSLAYLVWDQYNSDPAEKLYTFSKESRLMEKINNEWKIVNVTAFWDYRNLHTAESLK